MHKVKHNDLVKLDVTTHTILARVKFPPAGASNLRDFITIPLHNEQIILDKAITPYCINQDTVTLVQTPKTCQLTNQPFLYRTQYENATHFFKVDTATYIDALRIRPISKKPIFICGMGRSGSTLLAKVLATLDAVPVFDEPDVYYNMARQKNPDGDLIRAVTAHFASDTTRLVIKQRSFVTFIIEQLLSALPDSRIIFLYRNPEDWVRSNLALLLRYPIPQWLVKRIVKPQLLPFISEEKLDNHSPIEWGALLWIAFMQHFQRLSEQGKVILPIHYQDLITEPKITLGKICNFCDLPTMDQSKMRSVFESDSQANTLLSKNRMKPTTLSKSQRLAIQTVVNKNDLSSDMRLSVSDGNKR